MRWVYQYQLRSFMDARYRGQRKHSTTAFGHVEVENLHRRSRAWQLRFYGQEDENCGYGQPLAMATLSCIKIPCIVFLQPTPALSGQSIYAHMLKGYLLDFPAIRNNPTM